MYQLIKELYKTLITKGMSLAQVDESDIFFLLDLYFTKEKQDTLVYANQVPWL